MKSKLKAKEKKINKVSVFIILFILYILAFVIFSIFVINSSGTKTKDSDSLRNYHILVIGEYQNRDYMEEMFKGIKSKSANYNVICELKVPKSEAENKNIQELFDYATYVNADGIIAYINNPELVIKQPYRIDGSIIPVVTTGQFAPGVNQTSFIGNSSWELGKIFADETKKMLNFSGNIHILKPKSYNAIVNSNIINSFNSEVKNFANLNVSILEKYDDIHKIAENKSETKKTDKVAIICLDQDDTINVAQLLTEYYKDNKIMLIGFGNNETCRLYLSKKVISELIYLNPVKIGETALNELFEYRTKGYSNSYVTVATQIIKSRW